jgi:hypothetical protein
MSKLPWLLLFTTSIGAGSIGAGCGGGPASVDGGVDAPSLDAGTDAPSLDAAADAPADAPTDAGNDAPSDAPTCSDTVLLAGGTDVEAQGWSVTMQAPATLTYGADDVRIATTTTGGIGGQLLLVRAGALTPGMPFRLEVVMQVEAVNAHNAFDAAAAILGSFTPPFGVGADRGQMIYLDAARLGWADDSSAFTAAITDGAFHTYVLAVDASGTATVSIDGTPALIRGDFVTNGTIAIGDQTNDPDVDATMRIRSVSLLCP